jgi:hypothetical protein
VSVRSQRCVRALASLLVLLALCVVAPTPRAAEAYREEAVKAAFLHRFTGFVEWPETAFEGGVFRIAVLGAPEVRDELQRLLADKSIKGRPVSVTSVADRSSSKPQLLYVGRGYSGSLPRLLAEHRGRPVLIVTDQPGGLEAGGIINFLLVNQRVRFEMSPAPAQSAGLHISSQLLAVAVRVLGGRGERSQ